MSESDLSKKFADLALFYARKLKEGTSFHSIEDIVRQWRVDCEQDALMRDIRQGILDHAAGRGIPVEAVFAEIRESLGLT